MVIFGSLWTIIPLTKQRVAKIGASTSMLTLPRRQFAGTAHGDG
jgi:hypothetical protein